ncbi:MAG: Uma2 family endonuclease [Hyphomicrobium aestuarii]|nr:Uma2 family endonuclease [Hyphomicrobium aestuarii]
MPKRDEILHTYADYLGWPEDVRYELIDGVAYLISPGPDLAHQDVAGEIYYQLRQALEDRPFRAYIAPLDVRLPKVGERDELIDTVVQPDVMVVCQIERLDRRGVRGAPDFVVEVLSPSTASHDQVRKLGVYERAGVREYWLVHPTDRVLTVYRLGADGFGKADVQELAGTTDVGVLPGVSITWDALLARLPPLEF